MRGFRVPFRDIHAFFRNIWVFRKALWNYRRWDYCGLLELIEKASLDMAECHEKCGHLDRSEQTAKELKVFAEYMKRLRRDDYDTRYVQLKWNPDKRPMIEVNPIKYEGPKYGTNNYRKVEKDWVSNDLRQAAKIFERKVKTWWD